MKYKINFQSKKDSLVPLRNRTMISISVDVTRCRVEQTGLMKSSFFLNEVITWSGALWIAATSDE